MASGFFICRPAGVRRGILDNYSRQDIINTEMREPQKRKFPEKTGSFCVF